MQATYITRALKGFLSLFTLSDKIDNLQTQLDDSTKLLETRVYAISKELRAHMRDEPTRGREQDRILLDVSNGLAGVEGQVSVLVKLVTPPKADH